MRWPFVSRREWLRREAADWIARLNGPHGEEDRAAFERWYASSAEHARAYDRLSALFQAAGKLRRADETGAEWTGRTAVSPSRPLRYAFAAAVACAALLAFFLLSARTGSPVLESGQQFAAFSTEGREARSIVLADGSEVLLSPDSRLDIAIGTAERRLRLIRGEGRFAVAREARPFIVEASGAEVIARGTLFVVQVAGGRTTVSLIEGRVDVAYPGEGGEVGQGRMARLEPGERLVVETADRRAATPAAPASAAGVTRPRPSPQIMLQFDDQALLEAIEQVNRHARPQIRLESPALARLRITGAFHVGDARGFAESVAAAFDLEVHRGPEGDFWLRRRAEGAD